MFVLWKDPKEKKNPFHFTISNNKKNTYLIESIFLPKLMEKFSFYLFCLVNIHVYIVVQSRSMLHCFKHYCFCSLYIANLHRKPCLADGPDKNVKRPWRLITDDAPCSQPRRSPLSPAQFHGSPCGDTTEAQTIHIFKLVLKTWYNTFYIFLRFEKSIGQAFSF